MDRFVITTINNTITKEVFIQCDKTFFVPNHVLKEITDAIDYYLWGFGPILFCAFLVCVAIIVTIKEIKAQQIKELERRNKELETIIGGKH